MKSDCNNSHRLATTLTSCLLVFSLAGCAALQQPVAPAETRPAVTIGAAESSTNESSTAPVAGSPAASAAGISADAAAAASAAIETPALVPLPNVLPAGPGAQLAPGDIGDRTDLWERLRQGYVMENVDGALVSAWEKWYATRPAYVQRMTERGGRYLFHIVEEVERRGMPTELALLPFIESAFNPQAMSRVRASGMWQFMPATGREFELRQNLFRDDRRSVLASTAAALDYLQRLHNRFGDWHLALAAYNWGQGNVQRAIDRNRKAGLGTAYADLRMPDETRNYVPKLQAVKNIIGKPADFSLVLPPLENHPYFLSVAIKRDIDVALAARLAGLSVEDFKQLNPQMNKPVILASGTPEVLLPYNNADQFLRGMTEHSGPFASWTAWVAQRNIRTAEAAKLVGMPEAMLREVNRIPLRMMVKKGSTLLVPRAASAKYDVAVHIADTASIALTPEARPLRRVSFKARKGETVTTVARRYRVSSSLVAEWNGVSSNAKFKTGQQLVVMLPPKAKQQRRNAATPAKARAQGKSTATKRAAPAKPRAKAAEAATAAKK